MHLRLPNIDINFISVLYRDDEVQDYNPDEIFDFIRMSDEFGFTGILLFESNRGNVEPWILGQAIATQSASLIPFIAVNPLYMHPFIAAKKILTLSKLYNRKLYINYITGTSTSDLTNLNDHLSHDERYFRLIEYIQIVNHLLNSRTPLNFSGRYYSVKNLILSTAINSDLLPEYFIAGSSEVAQEARKVTGAYKATMAQDVSEWQDKELLHINGTAVHFGMIARETAIQATNHLDKWLCETPDTIDLFEYVMSKTESEWKTRLAQQVEEKKSVFTLRPFKNLKSDCPYYVGSHEQNADVFLKYILNGYKTFIIELPSKRDEFIHIQKVIELTEFRLRNFLSNGK